MPPGEQPALFGVRDTVPDTFFGAPIWPFRSASLTHQRHDPDNPAVASWTLDRTEGEALRIAFTGHLSSEDGRLSAAEFRSALRGGPRTLVWDVRRMTGYDGFARTAWQQALWDVRQNIRGITVIGGSSFVRVGAWTIALFLRVSCRFVEDTERTAS